LLPWIIPHAKWRKIENGLTQRLAALNLFLEDIYNHGRILADGVVARELVYRCRHFRREMRGLTIPRGIYVSICGTDLVRLPDGRFALFEDNLRVPSGVSYILANRKVLKKLFPTFFRDYGVSPVDHYAQALLATLRALAPAGSSTRHEPKVVFLTPGVFQLSLFRAHIPCAADGHRAGRGPRSPGARQHSLYAYDRWPAARGCDLPPRRR
jgi:uncharacterized circularly permuted ATP-grasp superfamily protein